MTRADWQQIAEERLLAAAALLASQNWPSAYYLAGYAVECGLKSCIVARLAAAPELIFVERDFSRRCWVHNIEALVVLANLRSLRDADIAADPVLGQNWLTVKDWNEESRYAIKTQPQAEGLYNAITDQLHGVMQWIRLRW